MRPRTRRAHHHRHPQRATTRTRPPCGKRRSRVTRTRSRTDPNPSAWTSRLLATSTSTAYRSTPISSHFAPQRKHCVQRNNVLFCCVLLVFEFQIQRTFIQKRRSVSFVQSGRVRVRAEQPDGSLRLHSIHDCSQVFALFFAIFTLR